MKVNLFVMMTTIQLASSREAVHKQYRTASNFVLLFCSPWAISQTVRVEVVQKLFNYKDTSESNKNLSKMNVFLDISKNFKLRFSCSSKIFETV